MKCTKLLAKWDNFKFENGCLEETRCRKLCCSQMTQALEILTFSPQQTGPYKGCFRVARPTRTPIQSYLWLQRLHGQCPSGSNCWPERGGSAIKRIKTRMRSRLSGDMLNALMLVSINGPSFGTEGCDNILQRGA